MNNKKLERLQKINNFILSNKMKYIDWTISGSFFIYALYLTYIQDEKYIYWLIGSSLAVLFSIIRPANRLHDRINKNIKK